MRDLGYQVFETYHARMRDIFNRLHLFCNYYKCISCRGFAFVCYVLWVGGHL